jgi:excisionase family DNA binding protein
MTERLIRKRDARKILGVGETTLDQLIERGLLPVVRFTTRSVRIRESAIAELIERCEREPQDAA